jgi:hypothetical protein
MALLSKSVDNLAMLIGEKSALALVGTTEQARREQAVWPRGSPPAPCKASSLLSESTAMFNRVKRKKKGLVKKWGQG